MILKPSRRSESGSESDGDNHLENGDHVQPYSEALSTVLLDYRQYTHHLQLSVTVDHGMHTGPQAHLTRNEIRTEERHCAASEDPWGRWAIDRNSPLISLASRRHTYFGSQRSLDPWRVFCNAGTSQCWPIIQELAPSLLAGSCLCGTFFDHYGVGWRLDSTTSVRSWLFV